MKMKTLTRIEFEEEYSNILQGEEFKEYMTLHNGILYIEEHRTEKTKGGIIKPEMVVEKEKNMTNDAIFYRVLKVGKEVRNIKVGDLIQKGRLSPFGVDLDGRRLYIRHENDTVGIRRKGGVDLNEMIDAAKEFSNFQG